MTVHDPFEEEPGWGKIHLKPETPITDRESLNAKIESLDEVSREKVMKFQAEWQEVCLLLKNSEEADQGLILTPRQVQIIIRALVLLNAKTRRDREDPF